MLVQRLRAMPNYAEHFSTRSTPQSEQADPRQVPNSAGGYAFQVDCWKRLERWLILGAEGGTYYATERKLTIENAKAIQECLRQDGPRAVAIIAEISHRGRAPKNDAAIFALAMASGDKSDATRAAALAAVPRVCRTGTHLFQFADAARAFRGWGRGMRRAVAGWYESMEPERAAYQVFKYQQRGGRSHRDLMRLCHPELGSAEHRAIARWVVAGSEFGEREVSRGTPRGKSPPVVRKYAAVDAEKLPALLAHYEELKAAASERDVVRLIREHGYTHEMIPSQWKQSAAVWEALLERMPLGATIRQLGKLSAVGVLSPMSEAARRVADRLTDKRALTKARVHPVAMLTALMTYKQGRGERGRLSWDASREIVDALDAGFYEAFDAVVPTGMRIMLAIDVSGSMSGGVVAGSPGLTPRLGAAALAMVTARTEQRWHCVGFSSGAPGEFTFGDGRSTHYGYRAGITELQISPRQRLDDVVRTMEAVPMGGTDCALPMLYAGARRLEVDAFVVLTDYETWAGNVHPHQALRTYRDKTGIPAKLATVGLTGNAFTIADPADEGMMDFVGFDSSAPAIMADFIRGGAAVEETQAVEDREEPAEGGGEEQ
jgi:60 kDa SS-A/Ro ribonucleoprotein